LADFVYMRADGIHVNIRLEEHKLRVAARVAAGGGLIRAGTVFPAGVLAERPASAAA
jgi:hypothetical protein